MHTVWPLTQVLLTKPLLTAPTTSSNSLSHDVGPEPSLEWPRFRLHVHKKLHARHLHFDLSGQAQLCRDRRTGTRTRTADVRAHVCGPETSCSSGRTSLGFPLGTRRRAV